MLSAAVLAAALPVAGMLLGEAAAKGHAHPPAAAEAAPTADDARAAFDRFKALEGKWRGKSTKGWEEESTYRVIAGGSAVLGTSFDAHPGETMATLFTLNDGALELTHYCVAKNAPRLRATKFTEAGRVVEFTFVDGANLSDRNRGHMDRAIYRFLPDGRVSSRWTWYQDGKERWMEEIELVRLPTAPAAAMPGTR
jgi:hypothetical protein